MTRFASKLAAAVATLALAATTAHAAPATVTISDLDLASTAGRAEFDARVDKAAREFCKGRTVSWSRIADNRSCVAGVRAEMNEKLAQVRTAPTQAYAAR